MGFSIRNFENLKIQVFEQFWFQESQAGVLFSYIFQTVVCGQEIQNFVKDFLDNLSH